MISLQPLSKTRHQCPFDAAPLQVLGWYMPGMRTMADLRCEKCGREYYGDLPAGHGRYYPMLLEKNSGDVHDAQGVRWFADWLRTAFAHRSKEPLALQTEEFRPLRAPLLLNCLDTLYGHCLLKLLNAQHYLDMRPELDLVVLVPRILRWLVPDGVAAIWTVDLPLRRGTEWNDWLAAEIDVRLKGFDTVWLSVAHSHPHPKDVDIRRFTRVQPFAVETWQARMERPTITYIWRDDRLWGAHGRSGRLRRGADAAKAKMGIGGMALPRREQLRRIARLAAGLRWFFPEIDFTVAGVGEPGGFPGWIADARTTAVDAAVENAWCVRYSRSHVVIGIHGSNMLLPSAHAGATVELIPPQCWGNVVQDLIMSDLDCREALCRYRIVPESVSVRDLTTMISSLLRSYPAMERNFKHRHPPDSRV